MNSMRDILLKHVRAIYQDWHHCGLSAKDAKAMKLEVGRLCDVCEDYAKIKVDDIIKDIMK